MYQRWYARLCVCSDHKRREIFLREDRIGRYQFSLECVGHLLQRCEGFNDPSWNYRVRYATAIRHSPQYTDLAVAQTSPAARTGSGNGSGSAPRPTGSNGIDADSSSSSGDSSKSTKSNVPIIAGAVVGVVLGLGAIGAVLFYFMWRRRHAQSGNKEEATHNLTDMPDNNTYKPELDSTAPAVMPSAGSPSVSSLKPVSPTREDEISPVSAGHHPPAQLSSTPSVQPRPELQGMHEVSPQAYSLAAEAYGQSLYEAPSQAYRENHVAPGQAAPASQTYQQPMGWQSGPLHEMDGGYRGGHH